LNNILKTAMFFPFVLAGAIALVFLSYVFVPVMVVLFIGMLIFAAVKTSNGHEI